APAEVDVVSGNAELRLEPADLLQRLLAKRHVAAGDVLGLAIGDQHVNRGAWRVGEAAGDGGANGRWHVRAADAGVVGALEGGGEVQQPVLVGHGVVVEVGDDLAAGRLHAGIASRGEAAVVGADHEDLVFLRDRERRVRRAVVYDDHLEVWIAQLHQALEASAQGLRTVEGANDYGDSRPAAARRRQGALERRSRRMQRWLGPAVPAREPEVPIVDLLAADGGCDL